ncbi:hypothetical protein [Nostoc sp. PCC 9305]|uniref:hypothetical protein n=1 Tax=Nostoc sp. PCC 9305 TaxID=296636 RepID=UPI0039C5C913
MSDDKPLCVYASLYAIHSGLTVATCNTNRSNLQSRHLQTYKCAIPEAEFIAP